jgi:hypothetical protein
VILKLDLHTHTARYSPCSQLSPNALCETALARGLDAVAITEHHHQWPAAEIAELQDRYPALKLYAGVEISCTDGHDYVVFGLDAGAYQPHPMPYARLQAMLDAHPGSFCFVAHCFRFSTDESGLEERAIQGIEMGSWNMLARRQAKSGPVIIAHQALYLHWQQRMGWIPLYNSDAHSARMVGVFCNLIDVPEGGLPEDARGLCQLLRQAAIRPFEDRTRIPGARRR